MRVPFGYTYQNGVISVNPDQAVWVKKVFEDYLEFKSMKQIATELNENKVAGRNWYEKTVSDVLENPFYAYAHEPIVSVDLFTDVQAMIDRKGTDIVSSSSPYPFSKVLVCAKCGDSYYANQSKVRGNIYIQYRCKHDCGIKDISELKLEKLFLKEVKNLELNDGAQRVINKWDKLTQLQKKQFVQSFFKKIIYSGDILLEMSD